VTIGGSQAALGDWLDHGLKKLLANPQLEKIENSILEEYHGIIQSFERGRQVIENLASVNIRKF
jgi:hypothetical protein